MIDLDEMRDGADRSAEEVFFQYGNMLYRIAFVMMKMPSMPRISCRMP